MKAALITEEQIKTIEDAFNLLEYYYPCDCWHEEALAIVKSLKVQEPVAYGYKDKHGDIADCLRNKHADDKFPYDVPLYAGEQV